MKKLWKRNIHYMYCWPYTISILCTHRQHSGQAVVLGRLSLSMCLCVWVWAPMYDLHFLKYLNEEILLPIPPPHTACSHTSGDTLSCLPSVDTPTPAPHSHTQHALMVVRPTVCLIVGLSLTKGIITNNSGNYRNGLVQPSGPNHKPLTFFQIPNSAFCSSATKN